MSATLPVLFAQFTKLLDELVSEDVDALLDARVFELIRQALTELMQHDVVVEAACRVLLVLVNFDQARADMWNSRRVSV
jgi:hypothetical protein